MTSWRRRLAAFAVAVGSVGFGASGMLSAIDRTTLGGLAPAASAATPTSSASPQRFAITLDELSPKVVRPGDTLTLGGTMVNTSGETLTAVSYALRISTQRITTRYQLAQDADPSATFGIVLSSTRQAAGDDGKVAPGQRVSWQLSLPIERVSMPTSPDQFGAFPIAIEVTSHGESGTDHGRLSTTMMWMPKGAHFTPTKIGWLWPVIDGIHRGLGDTFTDDKLATELAPDGRLGKLVSTAATSKTPVTYVVDPALVDAATAMAATAATGATATGPAPARLPAQPPGRQARQTPHPHPGRRPARGRHRQAREGRKPAPPRQPHRPNRPPARVLSRVRIKSPTAPARRRRRTAPARQSRPPGLASCAPR